MLRRQVDLVQYLGRGDQNFFRNAAANRAGAADIAGFDHGDRPARRPRYACSPHPGIAGAENNDVIIIGHLRPLLLLARSTRRADF